MTVVFRHALILASCFALFSCTSTPIVEAPDPLPSWKNGPSRQAIVDFVDSVTNENSTDFVQPSERVAVFDNDGTLWAEKPVYFQFLFILDRIRVMAPKHPEWISTQPFQAVLEGDWETLRTASRDELAYMMATAMTGMTAGEFNRLVTEWIETARHPETGRLITKMVYQPMRELLDYLEANGFTTYIVSGGGIDFMRPWSGEAYGIPAERVVGSSMELEYELIDGAPVIRRKPSLHFLNDKAGKPIGIQRFIGRRPILAAGNSDGDYEMLEWTTAGEGRRLGLIIHHTDNEREWAYDRDSSVGKLDRALDNAAANGWLLVDMARDWSVIYPPE